MGGGPPMKINVKKLNRRTLDCMEEMTAMFACMGKVGLTNIDDGCAHEKKALADCAEMVARRGKQRNSINHHLQRLSRAMARR